MPILMNAPTPMKTIIVWTGLIANIPKGWLICDGTNGTPDLRARFIRCVPTSTDPGGTGGTDTHTLTTAQLPVHGHTLTDPTHAHDWGTGGSAADQGSTVSSANALASPSVGTTGSDGSHENRPTFYEVLYIQKVSDHG